MNFNEEFSILKNLPDEDILNEMAQIGKFDSYVVFVRTNDPGNIPHFHVWDANTHGGHFHTCVRLDEHEYFHHTGKEDVFNSKDRKDLYNFLNAPSEDEPEKTNWQVLVIEWNRNNSDRKVSKDLEIPDYRLL